MVEFHDMWMVFQFTIGARDVFEIINESIENVVSRVWVALVFVVSILAIFVRTLSAIRRAKKVRQSLFALDARLRNELLITKFFVF